MISKFYLVVSGSHFPGVPAYAIQSVLNESIRIMKGADSPVVIAQMNSESPGGERVLFTNPLGEAQKAHVFQFHPGLGIVGAKIEQDDKLMVFLNRTLRYILTVDMMVDSLSVGPSFRGTTEITVGIVDADWELIMCTGFFNYTPYESLFPYEVPLHGNDPNAEVARSEKLDVLREAIGFNTKLTEYQNSKGEGEPVTLHEYQQYRPQDKQELREQQEQEQQQRSNSKSDCKDDEEQQNGEAAAEFISILNAKYGRGHTQTSSVKTMVVVLIEGWENGWCSTAINRYNALLDLVSSSIPWLLRMGATVSWVLGCFADAYAGTLQREAAVMLHRYNHIANDGRGEPQEMLDISCNCLYEGYRSHMGGPHKMIPSEYWNESTLIVDSFSELGAAVQALGVTDIIVADLTGSASRLEALINHPLFQNVKVLVAGDVSDHGCDRLDGLQWIDITHSASVSGFIPHMKHDGAILLRPWGSREYPYFVQAGSHPIVVEAEAKGGCNDLQCSLYYTVDGTDPSPVTSEEFYPETGILVDSTTVVKVAAFRDQDGHPCCNITAESWIYFTPPTPRKVGAKAKTRLQDVTPISFHVFKRYESFFMYPFSDQGMRMQPSFGRAYAGGDLKWGKKMFKHGIGVHAPARIVYQVDETHNSFSALCFVDETMLSENNGLELASHPSIVCKIFVDGKLEQESPVLRLGSPPWPFQYQFSSGKHLLDLVITDAGDGNRLDMAIWAEPTLWST